MLFLAGAAAGSAVDLIAALKQTLESPKGAAGSAVNFNVDGSAEAGAASQPNPAPPPLPLTPGTMNALLQAQGQSTSKGLMALLDSDHNGTVAQSEFEQVLGQNGNLAKTDDVFAKLDANKDGNIDANEMTAALKSRRGRRRHGGVEVASAASANAMLERLMQKQAEMLSSAGASSSMSVSV